MTTRTPLFTEQDYRFYKDDAVQASATAWAAINTTTSIPLDQAFRLVVNLGETNNANSANSLAFKLQYRIGAGTWTDVGSGTAIRFTTGAGLVSDANNYATQRLNTITSATYTSSYNEFDTNNTLTTRTWAAQGCEYEFLLIAPTGGGAVATNSITFRLVTTGNVTVNTQTNVPTYTVTAALTRVTNDYADSYTLYGRITDDFADAYTVSTRIVDDFADAYTVNARITSSFSDSYTVTAGSQYARPASDITTGSWLPSTPAQPLYSMIDEQVADDNDYIYVGAASSMSEVKLSTVGNPGAGFGHAVRVRAKGNAGQTLRVALMQGATQKATWDQVLTGTAATYTFALTAGEVSSLSDYSDLRLRFTGL